MEMALSNSQSRSSSTNHLYVVTSANVEGYREVSCVLAEATHFKVRSRLVDEKSTFLARPTNLLIQPMFTLQSFIFIPCCPTVTFSKISFHNNPFVPSSTNILLNPSYGRTWSFLCTAKNPNKKLHSKDFDIDIFEEEGEQEDDGGDDDGFSPQAMRTGGGRDFDPGEEQEYEDNNEGGFSGRGPYTGRDKKDYDRDPEFADILGSCLDDPQKAQSKMEERLGRKRNKILQTKTGSALPVKVSFNKFGFSNSYIWLEFYHAPLEKDISLICDTIRAWHIIGRLGGCNSMNMQLSQSPLDKRPSYDHIQGANVTPTTFYNIGDLEVQDNLARVWVDIGTNEPLLLDVLINALIQISSDHVGIKQVMFGGTEFENWKENLTSEDSGCSVHKI